MKRIIAFFTLPLLILLSFGLYEYQAQQRVNAQMRADRPTIEELVVQLATQEYTIREGQPPKSLEDLVTAGYLRQIPGRPPNYDVPVMPPL